ncbi:7625_t:CDS:2, partial [Gigaspora rosea]
DIATKIWKHNLACLGLARLNTMQLSLKPDQKDWGLIEKGQEWHRTNRGLLCKGRKAKWFTLVEKELLKEEGSRELLVAKENSCWNIRCVVRKEQETILTEHWVQESQDETTEMIVERCEGCNQNRLETSQSCKEQTERSDIVGVLPTRPHGNGKRKLDLNGKRREVENNDMLELPQRLEEVQDLGIEIIRNQKLTLEVVARSVQADPVKGHSGVIWNKVANQLAKKGSEVTDSQRCVTALPPVQSWHLTEAITKEQPQDKDMKFKWSLLWNRIKRQNGIRCTSIRKNRILG